MNHTPGPWKIIITEHPKMISYYEIKIGVRLISVFPYTRIESKWDGKNYGGLVIDETHLADIRLMTAAPDLLEACEQALEVKQTGNTTRKLLKAIKKARGEG